MKKRFLYIFLFAVLTLTAYSQPYPRGEVFDQKAYDSIPRKATQLSRAYDNLPQAVSLKSFAPTPGNQNPYGTCTAWATAYAARTIAESVSLGRKNKSQTDANVFSPVFVYKNISSDSSCKSGTYISDALALMKYTGAVKRQEIEKTMDFARVSLSVFSSARKYTIADYSTLFESGIAAYSTKTDTVKKALSENKPVIISLNCADSFDYAGSVWYPSENPAYFYGGHALCVVGYDDNKAGGAFEIINSWGTNWGNSGYVWIPYRTFEQFIRGAYEITDNLAAYGERNKFSGSVQIEMRGGGSMPVQLKNGYYETTESYTEGTRFRYLMSNDSPAYVYAFAADDSGKPANAIFPPEGPGVNVSALLDYRENAVAFPGEREWIQLDGVKGSDYLVVLYSKEALDIASIRRNFDKTKGAFADRVATAVGNNYIKASEVKYESSAMKYRTETYNASAVAGLLLAIKHR